MHNSFVGYVKCQKCRFVLVPDTFKTYKNDQCDMSYCQSYNIRKFIYLEEKLPDWINVKVQEENWTKGKLHCPNCGCKVGSFDFVSGRKCDCGSSVLPPVHFVTSQVDIPML